MKLALALVFVATALQARMFEHCGISFEYPDSWTAVGNPSGVYDFGMTARCVVGLLPPGWRAFRAKSNLSLPPYPVTVRMIDRPFLQVTRKAGFLRLSDFDPDDYPDRTHRAPEGWAIIVRQGTEPAKPFETACCRGVRGQSWSIGRAKDGSRETDTNDVAVLNDRHEHSALIDACSDSAYRDVVGRLIRTLHFIVP